MSEHLSPPEVVRALMDGISRDAWQDLDQLFSADAVIDYPFALPAAKQLVGIEQIRKYFRTVAALPLKLRARELVIHETADPEVVVAEWDYDGETTHTGRVFRVSNITVTRVHKGKIVKSRDYHNHFAISEMLGRGSP